MKHSILGAALMLGLGISTADASDYCREYSTDIRVGGQAQRSYGTACLQPDGSWELVKRTSNQPAFPVQTTIIHDAPPPIRYRQVTYERPYVYPTLPFFSISFNSRRDWHDDRRGHDRHHNKHRGHNRHHDRHHGKHHDRW